ncbi:MAG: hypothetical protein LBT84_05110 [Spirochaetia bacterium]|jgi:hypothetical protein|nr:hypothetical protein [Spirochaetia bacterium]
MKKITAFASAALALCALRLSAAEPAHVYRAEAGIANSTYGERAGTFGAKDNFSVGGAHIHNSLDLMYSENSENAVTDNFTRLSELLVVKTENFRFSGLVRSLYYKDGDMGNNFQYFAFIERQVKISGAYTLDFGLVFTDMFVYNRIYPGPVFFPLMACTYRTPSSVVRIGLPTLLMYKAPKWSTGFSYTMMFNSKIFLKWMPSSLVSLELFTDTVRYQIAVGDPKRDEVLNIFYAGIFLEASLYMGEHTAFSLCGGYNFLERRWTGDQLSIMTASQKAGSYKLKGALSFMF